jgi:hypothetical protein
MKRNLFFTFLLVGISVLFLACPNPSNGGTKGPADLIANSSWSDTLVPDTTLLFSINQVTLGGQSSAVTNNKNWYWGDMDGRTYTFDLVEDGAAIADLLDQVEDNWGTNYTTFPDAVIVVWTDPIKKVGFQLHYYAEGSGKSYERLICWGVGQPHEFKRQ